MSVFVLLEGFKCTLEVDGWFMGGTLSIGYVIADFESDDVATWQTSPFALCEMLPEIVPVWLCNGELLDKLSCLTGD